MQATDFRHQLLHGEFACLTLPVDDSREKQGRGEPEAGAQGHEDHDYGPWQLDGVHDLLVFQGARTDCLL